MAEVDKEDMSRYEMILKAIGSVDFKEIFLVVLSKREWAASVIFKDKRDGEPVHDKRFRFTGGRLIAE